MIIDISIAFVLAYADKSIILEYVLCKEHIKMKLRSQSYVC
jgi:hypothetical protein